jgi:hypothetical protein
VTQFTPSIQVIVHWSSVAWHSYRVTAKSAICLKRSHQFQESRVVQVSSSACRTLISFMSQRFCCAKLLFSHIRHWRFTLRQCGPILIPLFSKEGDNMEMDSGRKTVHVCCNTEAVVLGWDHRWHSWYFRRTTRTTLIQLTWPTVLQALLERDDQPYDLHKK